MGWYMRVLSTAIFLFLALASTSAQRVPVCPGNPPDIPALAAEAASGNPRAQLELGRAYSETKDPEKLSMSAYWFEKAAEQGNAEAEWRLSEAYGAGEGIPRDDKSALNWLKKAAEDGQVQAQRVLGMDYRDGRFVERDEKKAFDLFLRAARQGDVDSQVSVAQMYEDGDVVPRDYVKAVYWYKKAAEHVPDYGGAGQGRNSLGMLYLEGNGVSQDYMAAYMYFALANSKGNMEWAAEKMTSPQISEAQQKAEEWVQQHPEPRLCSQGIGFSKAVSITEKVRN